MKRHKASQTKFNLTNSENISMKGGCHCGAIRYEVLGKSFDADYCHCRDCQKTTGSPVGVWMDFKKKHIRWLGEKPKEYKSSENIRRGFCAHCGCSLSYRSIDYPDYYTLSVASLDDPNKVTPNYHIYTNSQVKWLTIHDSCTKYPQGRSD
jgi:hypothetical protein